MSPGCLTCRGFFFFQNSVFLYELNLALRGTPPLYHNIKFERIAKIRRPKLYMLKCVRWNIRWWFIYFGFAPFVICLLGKPQTSRRRQTAPITYRYMLNTLERNRITGVRENFTYTLKNEPRSVNGQPIFNSVFLYEPKLALRGMYEIIVTFLVWAIMFVHHNFFAKDGHARRVPRGNQLDGLPRVVSLINRRLRKYTHTLETTKFVLI